MQESVVHPRLRVLHASPNAPAVDIYIDESRRIVDLAYGQRSEHLSIWPERHRLRILPTGQSEPQDVLAGDELGRLLPGQDYTIVAIGKPKEMRVVLFEDSAPLPTVGRERFLDPGRCVVRFLHASPDAPALDVDVSGRPALFRQVGFAEATPFREIVAGTYDLAARRAGHDALVATMPQYAFASGNRYTVVALGLLDGQPAFELWPLVDAFEVCPA